MEASEPTGRASLFAGNGILSVAPKSKPLAVGSMPKRDEQQKVTALRRTFLGHCTGHAARSLRASLVDGVNLDVYIFIYTSI
jgi:hypothetical protein